jgi:hypothetical protein
MRNSIAVAVAILLAAQPVAASEKKDAPELDPKTCQQMVAYVPQKGLNGADYTPGVDVHGKPVVEADINPSPIKMPETFTFEINVNVARYAHLTTPPGVWTKGAVGTVSVGKDGHMTFNGKPMEGEAEAALRGLCASKPAPQKDKQDKTEQKDNNHNQ